MAANSAQIKEHMPVVGSDGGQVGTVDHLDTQDMIKLAKDEQGRHHWLPTSDVTAVDDKVHLGHTARQARQEWMASAPTRE